MDKPELLAPAGNFEKMKTAIHYGADAVYMGMSSLSLRAKADNFSEMELEEAFHYAHARGVKCYATINIFPHNRDLPLVRDHIRFLEHGRSGQGRKLWGGSWRVGHDYSGGYFHGHGGGSRKNNERWWSPCS